MCVDMFAVTATLHWVDAVLLDLVVELASKSRQSLTHRQTSYLLYSYFIYISYNLYCKYK